jgi:hypothetical protein
MAIELAARTESVAGFVAVPLDLIRRQSIVEFDLYVAGRRQMVLYRSSQLPFTDEAARRLIDNGVSALWVRSKDEGALGRYVEDHLDEILADPSVQPIRKGQALYTAARGLDYSNAFNEDRLMFAGGGFQIAFSKTAADDWWTNPTAVGPTS